MSQIFVAGAARLSFDGVASFAQDLSGGPGTVFAFADQRIDFSTGENTGYPDLIDGESFPVNKVPGVTLGTVRVSGVVQPDRNFHAFVNSAFGPRTSGQLSPWMMNLTPYNGGAVVGATGVWWQSLRVFASFGIQGNAAMVMFTLTGMVLDPHNYYTAATLTPPATTGLPGAGVASFARCSFTNDAATPVVYDQIRSFDFGLSNRLQVIPSIKNAANRIAAGCVPGTIAGSLTLTQLKNATNSIPLAYGTYPIDVVIPSGDGTHTLTIATSQSFDSSGFPMSATDFVQNSASYSLFATSAGSTATAGFPFIASYV